MCFGEKSLRGSKSGAIWSRTAWGSPGHPGFGQMLIFLVKTHEHNQFFIINCFGHKKITNPIAMAKTKVLVQIAPGPNSPALAYVHLVKFLEWLSNNNQVGYLVFVIIFTFCL